MDARLDQVEGPYSINGRYHLEYAGIFNKLCMDKNLSNAYCEAIVRGDYTTANNIIEIICKSLDITTSSIISNNHTFMRRLSPNQFTKYCFLYVCLKPAKGHMNPYLGGTCVHD